MAPTGGQDRPMEVRETPIGVAASSAACFLAIASAAIGGVSWLLTFTPWARFMPNGYGIPFIALTPLVFGWAFVVIVSRRRGQPDRRRLDVRAELPRRVRAPLTAIWFIVGASLLTVPGEMPGSPVYVRASHTYAYEDGGVLVPMTHAAWLHAVAAQNRLVLGVSVMLTSMAAAIAWADWNSRRGLPTSGRWLHPVRPRPRRLPPAPVLLLGALAGLAGLVACAVLLVGRFDAYNNGIYLRAGQPVRAALAPDDYVVFVGCTQDMACPRLAPSDLFVRQADGGGTIAVISDPSSDHLSENAQPFIGALSFSVRQREAVTLELDARVGQPVFVVPSEGAEVRALAGWIALAVLALAVLAGAVAGLGILLTWRLGFGMPVAPGSGRPTAPGSGFSGPRFPDAAG